MKVRAALLAGVVVVICFGAALVIRHRTLSGDTKLAALIQRASIVEFLTNPPRSPGGGATIAMLPRQFNPGWYEVLKHLTPIGTHTPSGRIDCDVLIVTLKHEIVHRGYSTQTGELGSQNEWYFVPPQLNTWLKRQLARVPPQPI